MHPISILEFPSNLGLREPIPGHEPGVRKLPDWLKQHGLHERIRPVNTFTLAPPPYSMELDKTVGVRNVAAIVKYAKEQAALLKKVLERDTFVLALGGDCSILIGHMLALKEMGNYGLFFLDGHTDYMSPSLSQSGGAAGMDLSIVTGHVHDKLANIDHQKPYVAETNCWCVGNREYDEQYVNEIRQSDIHYVSLDALREQGIENCVKEFLHWVHHKKLDGFWIHVDLDVLDDGIMPAVDSRTPGGLSYTEFESVLEPLLRHPLAAGIELTILDPELDPDAEYTNPFIECFCDMIDRVRMQ